MYVIVTQALRTCTPSELRSLDETRQELIAQFIYVKVLRLHTNEATEGEGLTDPEAPAPARTSSAPSTAMALCAYFKRYLIDCTRASRLRRRVSIGEDGIDEARIEAELGANDDEESALRDHGLNDDQVKAAARRFIKELPEPERLLLCEGFGREVSGGLSGVASRHSIASYHYRAGKLGPWASRSNAKT